MTLFLKLYLAFSILLIVVFAIRGIVRYNAAKRRKSHRQFQGIPQVYDGVKEMLDRNEVINNKYKGNGKK